MTPEQLLAELTKLRRIVMGLAILSTFSFAVGVVGVWKAKNVETQLIRSNRQIDAEFASFGLNPEAYTGQMRQLHDALEATKQDFLRRKTDGTLGKSK
jgi:hypothetical protein